MREKPEISRKRILFHHGDFTKYVDSHPYFGPNGLINNSLQRLTKIRCCWNFAGGHINERNTRFWKLILNADIVFVRSQNMDYEDIKMHWNHAEDSMLEVLKRVKAINPDIKIFIYENESERDQEFEELGTMITDLHGDEEMIAYFKSLV